MSVPEEESMILLMRRILEGTRKLQDEEGYDVSEVFEALPDRSLLDYYRIIKRPVSLTKIGRNINNKRYKRFSEFIRDLAQISHNAKTYNEKGSIIYIHAEILENYVKNELERLAGKLSERELKFPNLGGIPGHSEEEFFEDDSDEDGAGGDDDDDDEDDYDDSHRGGSGRRKRRSSNRRGRPTRNAVLRRQKLQQQEEEEQAQMNQDEKRKKRGRPPTVDRPHEHRIKAIMRGVRKEKDARGGNRLLFKEFEKLPDQKYFPTYYEDIQKPIALDYIRKQIKRRQYPDVESFLADMNLMFNNAKLFNAEGSDIFNDAVQLQQVMVQLAEEEMKKPDSVYQDQDSNSKTSRIPLDSVEHRGETYRVGDWVHLANPNDASKPTIGQIFRIWRASDQQDYINVCWYYRPEQTVHRYDKLFYDNEVVKSGQYRDHLVDEILEKCFVMFVTRYQRGRPSGIGNRSVYCCESRYNENEKTFNKIRTWKACIPDEVRSVDYPMDMFERTHMLRRVISPIKDRLPPDARDDDPIPEPEVRAPNAPPFVGAVYKRPYDPEDPPEKPTDINEDIGTPKQMTTKRHSDSFGSGNTRQYTRQPQPYLPPGGGTPTTRATGGGATAASAASGQHHHGLTPSGGVHTPSSIHGSGGPGSMAPSPGGFYPVSHNSTPYMQPHYQQGGAGAMHGYMGGAGAGGRTPGVAGAIASSYLQQLPQSTFVLPRAAQDLLPNGDLNKVVKTQEGQMAWFVAPPVYVANRIATALVDGDYEGITFRFKRKRGANGALQQGAEGEVAVVEEDEDVDEEDEDDSDDENDDEVEEQRVRSAPLGHSAKYIAWKRNNMKRQCV